MDTYQKIKRYGGHHQISNELVDDVQDEAASKLSEDVTLFDMHWDQIQNLILPEVLSTASLIVISCLIRSILFLINDLASENKSVEREEFSSSGIVRLTVEFARILLYFLPKKAPAGFAPGFIFASTWIIFPIQDYFGPIPNLPTRISETVLGRVSYRELALIIPIHFLAARLGVISIRLVAPERVASTLTDPIIYVEDDLWLIDLIREIIINAAFTVSILAAPEILKLNKIPRALLLLFILPLYLYSVDSVNTSSSFGPDVLYALRCESVNDDLSLRHSPHVIGPLIGGFFGGKILSVFFPDEPQQ